MALLLLIRHGENDYTKKHKLAGHLPNVHLNERGHQVVAEALYSFMEANTSLGAKTRRN